MKHEKAILIYIICSFYFNIKAQPNQKDESFPDVEPFKNSIITSKLIPSLNNTWGYEILIDNKLIIHQSSIPALSGNDGFKSKEAAQKVADLVITKIKKGEMPPSITIEELKKLNILKTK